MLNCHNCRDWIVQGDDLCHDQYQEMQMHIECCPDCRQYHRLLTEMEKIACEQKGPDLSNITALRIKKAVNQALQIDTQAPRHYGPILDIDDLSAYVKIPRTEIEELIENIPHFYIGVHLRFRKESVENWLEAREQENTSRKPKIFSA